MILCQLICLPQVVDPSVHPLCLQVVECLHEFSSRLGRTANRARLGELRDLIREALRGIRGSIFPKDADGMWRYTDSRLVGALLLGAHDHVRFPNEVSCDLITSGCWRHVNCSLIRDRLDSECQSVSLFDLVDSSIASAACDVSMICIAVQEVDVWTTLKSVIRIPTTHQIQCGDDVMTFSFVGVVFYANENHDTSAFVVNENSLPGTGIVPGFYSHDGMSHRGYAQLEQSIEDFRSVTFVDDMLWKLSTGTLTNYPTGFYYCRDDQRGLPAIIHPISGS